MQSWGEKGGENPARLPALNLAFVGDAVYGTLVRERLLLEGGRPVGRLHADAVSYVCAQAQSRAYEELEGVLSERETEILRRGRNASSSRAPKSSSMIDYRRATAVEALFGYLYLAGERERLAVLMDRIFEAEKRNQPVASCTQEGPDDETARTRHE